MAQINALLGTRDARDGNVIGLTASSWIYAIYLTANTAQTVAVPDNAKHVLFAGSGNFQVMYCQKSTTLNQIASAAGINSSYKQNNEASATGQGAELNPALRTLLGIPCIGLIAPAACSVTMAFYT